MSLRNEAREFAVDAVRTAVHELGLLIERRIEWRWDNAPLLAAEAERMVFLLPKWRRIARAYWRARWRRFSAKAWAQDPSFASACKICHPNDIN